MSIHTNHGYNLEKPLAYNKFGTHENAVRVCNGANVTWKTTTDDPRRIQSATGGPASDTHLTGVPIHLPTDQTLTGFVYYQVAQGNFTADSNNRIGLYKPTDAAGNAWELVASSANNASLWKGTANTYVSEPMSSTYAATAGVYMIVWMYNQSAQTTAPTIGYVAGSAASGSWWLNFNRILPVGFGMVQVKYQNNFVPDLPSILSKGIMTTVSTASSPYPTDFWWGLY